MAREIDLTKALSEEDRKYLQDRCMWHKIAIADDAASAAEAQQAAVESHEVTTPPVRPETLVGQQAIVNAANETVEEDEEDLPYSEWDYKDLQAELKERGLNAGGSQADLVKRLEEDDEANPQ